MPAEVILNSAKRDCYFPIVCAILAMKEEMAFYLNITTITVIS